MVASLVQIAALCLILAGLSVIWGVGGALLGAGVTVLVVGLALEGR